MKNHYIEEMAAIKKEFNLDDVLTFETKHDVQITRHSDYMYLCHIDGITCGLGLTMLGALVNGMAQFKKVNFS